MARPVTLFTGQWVDLPLAKLAPLAEEMSYDGLELACGGDHFDVARALVEDSYVEEHRRFLYDHGLSCAAISNHLVGQVVCDPVDVVTGFTGSSIWGKLYLFPPAGPEMVEEGFRDFAERRARTGPQARQRLPLRGGPRRRPPTTRTPRGVHRGLRQRLLRRRPLGRPAWRVPRYSRRRARRTLHRTCGGESPQRAEVDRRPLKRRAVIP